MSDLGERLDNGEVIILDGAIGTELQRMGVPMNHGCWCAEALKTHPEVVRQLHEDYLKAGAEIGAGATIGAEATIEDDASVGEDAIIGANVTVKKNAEIGAGAMIGDGSTIEEGAKIGEDAVIETNVLIKKNACVGSSTTTVTTIATDFTIEEGIQIGDGETPLMSPVTADVGGTCNAPVAAP